MINFGMSFSAVNEDYVIAIPEADDPDHELYNTVLNGVKQNNSLIEPDKVSFYTASIVNTYKAIKDIKLASNNTDDQTAKAGDIVTMTFEQTCEIVTLTLNIAGGSVTPSKTGDKYTAYYTVVTDTPNTALQFSLWADGEEFTDTSGLGRCSRVLVDTVRPVVTLTDEFRDIQDITIREIVDFKWVTTIIGYVYDLYTTIKVSEKTNKLELTDLIISGGKVLRLYQDTEGYKLKIRPNYNATNYVTPSVQIKVNQDALKDDAGNGNLLVNHTSIVT